MFNDNLKYLIVLSISLFFGVNSNAQFTGGDANGFTGFRLGDTCSYIAFTPFAGGDSDGFSNFRLGDTCNYVAFTPFAGGDSDGFSNFRLGDTCNYVAFTPFAGGDSDGFSNFRLGDTCNYVAFTPFAGGDSDGFSNFRLGDTCNYVAFTPFAGGDSDGFSNFRLGDTCSYVAFTPFAGGDSDGFSNFRLGDTCSYVTFTPFAGGSSSGFAHDTLIVVNIITCEPLAPLPIELLNFDAVREDKKVRTFWTTLSERDNDYFTIERSIDGYNWKDVGTVPGAGNSTVWLDYVWYDLYPERGVSYYRLRQTDYDGKFSHSEIRTVVFGDTEDYLISVHPNPTNGLLHLTVLGEELDNADAEIVSLSGQIIYKLAGINGNTHSFNMVNYPKGVYLLRITTTKGVQVFKVVKQ